MQFENIKQVGLNNTNKGFAKFVMFYTLSSIFSVHSGHKCAILFNILKMTLNLFPLPHALFTGQAIIVNAALEDVIPKLHGTMSQ